MASETQDGGSTAKGTPGFQCIVRIRPPLPSDKESPCVVLDGDKITVKGTPNSREYVGFPLVVPPGISQEEAFRRMNVDSFVDAILAGFHATIIAYGQTSSGKTHTVIGSTQALDGIVPQAIERIYSRQNNLKGVKIRASFVEIGNGLVNECITDLLDPKKVNLQIRQNERKEPYIVDLTIWTRSETWLVFAGYSSAVSVVECETAEDAICVLQEGAKFRRTSSTKMNARSSRSHSVFTLYIDIPELQRFSKFQFVDLAGSERVKSTGAEGVTLKEAQTINKSLFTLAQVIMALTQAGNSKAAHVPYRNAKITELLSDSFGGSAYCMMITCINPCSADESNQTLQYATRALNIENRPIPNQKPSSNAGGPRMDQKAVENARQEAAEMVHREFAQEKQSMTDANQQLLDQVERMKRENENMLLQMQRLQDEADLQLPAGQNAAVGGGGGIVDRGDGGGGLGGGMFGIVSGQGGDLLSATGFPLPGVAHPGNPFFPPGAHQQQPGFFGPGGFFPPLGLAGAPGTMPHLHPGVNLHNPLGATSFAHQAQQLAVAASAMTPSPSGARVLGGAATSAMNLPAMLQHPVMQELLTVNPQMAQMLSMNPPLLAQLLQEHDECEVLDDGGEGDVVGGVLVPPTQLNQAGRPQTSTSSVSNSGVVLSTPTGAGGGGGLEGPIMDSIAPADGAVPATASPSSYASKFLTQQKLEQDKAVAVEQKRTSQARRNSVLADFLKQAASTGAGVAAPHDSLSISVGGATGAAAAAPSSAAGSTGTATGTTQRRASFLENLVASRRPSLGAAGIASQPAVFPGSASHPMLLAGTTTTGGSSSGKNSKAQSPKPAEAVPRSGIGGKPETSEASVSLNGPRKKVKTDAESLTSSSSDSDSGESGAEKVEQPKVMNARSFRQSIILRNNSIITEKGAGFSEDVQEALTAKPLEFKPTASAPTGGSAKSASASKSNANPHEAADETANNMSRLPNSDEAFYSGRNPELAPISFDSILNSITEQRERLATMLADSGTEPTKSYPRSVDNDFFGSSIFQRDHDHEGSGAPGGVGKMFGLLPGQSDSNLLSAVSNLANMFDADSGTKDASKSIYEYAPKPPSSSPPKGVTESSPRRGLGIGAGIGVQQATTSSLALEDHENHASVEDLLSRVESRKKNISQLLDELEEQDEKLLLNRSSSTTTAGGLAFGDDNYKMSHQSSLEDEINRIYDHYKSSEFLADDRELAGTGLDRQGGFTTLLDIRNYDEGDPMGVTLVDIDDDDPLAELGFSALEVLGEARTNRYSPTRYTATGASPLRQTVAGGAGAGGKSNPQHAHQPPQHRHTVGGGVTFASKKGVKPVGGGFAPTSAVGGGGGGGAKGSAKNTPRKSAKGAGKEQGKLPEQWSPAGGKLQKGGKEGGNGKGKQDKTGGSGKDVAAGLNKGKKSKSPSPPTSPKGKKKGGGKSPVEVTPQGKGSLSKGAAKQGGKSPTGKSPPPPLPPVGKKKGGKKSPGGNNVGKGGKWKSGPQSPLAVPPEKGKTFNGSKGEKAWSKAAPAAADKNKGSSIPIKGAGNKGGLEQKGALQQAVPGSPPPPPHPHPQLTTSTEQKLSATETILNDDGNRMGTSPGPPPRDPVTESIISSFESREVEVAPKEVALERIHALLDNVQSLKSRKRGEQDSWEAQRLQLLQQSFEMTAKDEQEDAETLEDLRRKTMDLLKTLEEKTGAAVSASSAGAKEVHGDPADHSNSSKPPSSAPSAAPKKSALSMLLQNKDQSGAALNPGAGSKQPHQQSTLKSLFNTEVSVQRLLGGGHGAAASSSMAALNLAAGGGPHAQQQLGGAAQVGPTRSMTGSGSGFNLAARNSSTSVSAGAGSTAKPSTNNPIKSSSSDTGVGRGNQDDPDSLTSKTLLAAESQLSSLRSDVAKWKAGSTGNEGGGVSTKELLSLKDNVAAMDEKLAEIAKSLASTS